MYTAKKQTIMTLSIAAMIVTVPLSLPLSASFFELRQSIPSTTLDLNIVLSHNVEKELEKHTNKTKAKDAESAIAQWNSKLSPMAQYYTKLNQPTLLKAWQAYKSAHNKLASVLYQYNNILKTSLENMRDLIKQYPNKYDNIMSYALEYMNNQLLELNKHYALLLNEKKILDSEKLFTGFLERNKEEKNEARKVLLQHIDSLMTNIVTVQHNTNALSMELKKMKAATKPSEAIAPSPFAPQMKQQLDW